MPVRAAATRAANAVQRQSKRVPQGGGRSRRGGLEKFEEGEEEEETFEDQDDDHSVTMQRSQKARDDDDEEDDDIVADSEQREEEDVKPIPSSSRTQPTRTSKYVLVSDHGQTFLAPASRASSYRTLPQQKPQREEGLEVDGVGTADEEDDSAAQTPMPVDDESGTSTPNLQQKKKNLIKIPLKRGRGRPPKIRPRGRIVEESEEPEGDDGVNTPNENGSVAPDDTEANTPAAEGDEDAEGGVDADFATRQSVYIEGRQYACVDDELQIDEDEAGNTKIDARGQLLGGRKFTFPVFQSPERPDPLKWYALSIDAARAAGHRDSFFFYRKNPLLVKLACTDQEKAWLIENKRLPAHLRSRSVNMVAARNIYKLHGAYIISGGKHVTDDYYEKAAREAGKIEGEPATDAQEEEFSSGGGLGNSIANTNVGLQPIRPMEKSRPAERDNKRRRPDAFTHATTDLHGNPWFTSFGDSGEAPFERAKAWPARRQNTQRAELNEGNWMIEMARSVRGMNRELLMSHAERLRAFGRPFEAIEGLPEDEEEEEAEIKQKQNEAEGEADESGDVKSGAEEEEIVADTSSTTAPANKKRKSASSAHLPIGLYEPLTNLPHYPITTQSRWANFERIHERPIIGSRPVLNGSHDDKPFTNGINNVKSEIEGDTSMADVSADSEDAPHGVQNGKTTIKAEKKGPILGGGKVGSYAWGVASIEQRVQLPQPRQGHDVRVSARASASEMDM
ncbi:uncharacterized protein FA14DRAFT_160383 [Meira miltonrushii]|uniref:Uncharacterized protein n=1 Tax=Meira miltonrushii TaxID=1280837 RepID=A0A316VBZ4_9BASI|nr:uncharacterized protein FA14DRAFT_160383 [Meira miltonrushii]PWN35056.1 hypothetical protein FA14DRAFT_160383 [Meira miltonrushii]